MNSAIFLTVRNKATRLPNKHFLKIKNRTTIEHLIDRLKLAKKVDRIILCTSGHPDDKVLVEVAKENNIDYFQGSENDKLDRYLEAAKKFDIELLIIVDGDDLFCDPEYIDRVIEKYEETKADFISCEGLPFGVASHSMTFQTLKDVCERKNESDTEVWGNYFYKNDKLKKEVINASPKVNYPEFRMSLDYKEDFDFFASVFEELGDKNTFSLTEIVELLKNKPEIREINRHMHEAYEKNIKKEEDIVTSDMMNINCEEEDN